MGLSRIEFVRMNSRRWAGFLPALVITAVVAACSQAMPTPTPLPNPTAVPTAAPTVVPAATPTLTGVVIAGDATLPAPDPEQLARLFRLLSLALEGYSSAVVIDVLALETSFLLQESINLEAIGLQGILPTAVISLLDGIGVAASGSGQGPLMMLDGQVDVETLLQLAGGQPKSERHRQHGVYSLDLAGLSMAVGQADATTAVLTAGSGAEGSSALERVKSSLDSFDGLSPNLLDDRETKQLLSMLPTGFAAALLGRCGDLRELAPVIDLSGCAGAAISAEVLDQDRMLFYGLVRFQDESSAAEALELAVQRIDAQGRLPLGSATVGQEKEIIWARLVVDRAQVTQALRAFSLASP